MSEQPGRPDESERVELIASGYEWICPDCQKFHQTMETAEEVQCQRCHRRYTVADIHHATP